MDSTSQSPSSSPNAVPPVSPADSTPPPQSNTTQLTDQLPPPSPLSNSSALPPQSTPPQPPTPSQSPPFAPPPSSSSPPPLPSAPLPSIISPPSPPQPSGVPPPEKSPPQIVSPSSPNPPPGASPHTGTMSPPPPHEVILPKHFPPLPPPTFASPPAPPTTSHLPGSPSPPSIHLPPHLNSSFVNGSTIAPHHPTLPTEKPLAGSTHSGRNITTDTIAGNSSGVKAGSIAAVSTVVGFLALTLVVVAVWLTHRKKRRKDLFTLHYGMPSPFASPPKSDLSFPRSYYLAQVTGSQSMKNFIYSPDDSMGGSRLCFTYEELFGATNGFSSDNILGEGGFGCVYKGVLVNGREVAVKQLKVGGGQGEREFRAEVEIISRIHHKHLVSLVGSCIAGSQRMLVYDFVANDTLHHHLHGKEPPVMDWASRVKAAAGAARGLAYLHEDCQPRIIHRDIKSTNILLDNNFEAQVADFGLAKLALELDLHTHVSTRVMGTFGYLAPEYAASGKLTEKSDVYSFGVVLLELITGRKPVDASRSLGDESLVEWARPLLSQALETEDFGEDLIDYRLENNFVASEMLRMLEAAAACVRHSASKRPRMSQVVRALNCMDELADLNNGMKPGQSGEFDSREHSAEIRMFRRMAFGSQEYSSSEIFNNSHTSWRTNL